MLIKGRLHVCYFSGVVDPCEESNENVFRQIKHNIDLYKR